MNLKEIPYYAFIDPVNVYNFMTNKYYTTSNKLANKFYKENGLYSLKFVNNLKDLDEHIAHKFINKYNNKKLQLFYNDDSDNLFFYPLTESFKDFYNNIYKYNIINHQMIRDKDYIFTKDSPKYQKGTYIIVDLVHEHIMTYKWIIEDDKLYLDNDAYYEKADKFLFDNSMKTRFGNNILQIYNWNENVHLSYAEVKELQKKLKIKILNDIDNDFMKTLSDRKLTNNATDIKVKDVLKIFKDNMYSKYFNRILYFYDKILENNLDFIEN